MFLKYFYLQENLFVNLFFYLEKDFLIDFLESNPESKAALDVLADEIVSRKQSEILNFVNNSQQIIITPHVGGMTKEAQEIAYNHAAEMLSQYFNE